jgi:hypothetical protein
VARVAGGVVRPVKQIKVELPTGNGHEGAAAALKRLEQQELIEFTKLQALLSDPEADQFSIKTTRDTWLKLDESLRRYDALVEQARRESGALLPREVATALAQLVVAIRRGNARIWPRSVFSAVMRSHLCKASSMLSHSLGLVP